MKIKSLAILTIIATLVSCGKAKLGSYQGYIEGELTFLASPYSGILVDMFVSRGQQVKKGHLLFKLDDNPEQIMIKESEAQLLEAKKIYKDLSNPGRIPEIEAIQAQILQADAKLKLAQIKADRYRQLYEKRVTDKQTYDETVADLQGLQQLKAQYESNLELALQGSREEQVNAQQARINDAMAKLEKAKWQLAQKSVYAPADGVIYDTYYHEGEFVGNQQAVASLLTPANIRLQFFVPEDAIPLIHLGQKIDFTCDGCGTSNKAVISYISSTVEYMPPLVYSRDNANKLVFRVQADIKNASNYKPGQPAVVVGSSQ